MNLSIENVTVKIDKVEIVKSLSLHAKKGDFIGLIGPNGSGKSTLLKSIYGVLKYDKGSIKFDDKDIKTISLSEIAKEMAVVGQFNTINFELSVLEIVLMGRSPHLGGWEREKEEDYKIALDAIRKVGMEKSINRSFSTLSGGEKQRVILARALTQEPQILILDEPTNYLDINAKIWLENFLLDFKNTVIVVSHDRHFLNKVCTHILDIDYGKIKMYVGNYDFWLESSELIQKQMRDSNKKKEDKIKELQEFIRRFSANASKSKQATSRKKLLEKIELDDIAQSSRKYPYINFDIDRPLGRDVLELKGISKTVDGEVVLKNLNLTINNTDKVDFVGKNELAKTTLFKIITGEEKPDSGTIKWGATTSFSYFPKDHDKYFKEDVNLVDFLRPYSKEQEEAFLRGFLGRMLFSGEEALKKVSVLSGGEKVRLMFSRMMLKCANVIILDEPTNHLDIESITSLNKGMKNFKGVCLFSSYDYELINSVANRIIEFKEDGKYIDKMTTYDDYLNRN